MLAALKLLAGIFGASAAMLADALHSFSDLITDIILLVGAKLGSRPADDAYPYGHGRIETLATLIIAGVLLAAAGGIFWGGLKSALHVLRGGALEKPGYIALIMTAVSIIIKEWMYRYTVRVGKKIDSMAVISNAWHHRSDALSSVATFFGIGGAILLGNKWTVLDPLTAMAVSVFIAGIALKIAKDATDEMLDASLPEEYIERIKEICLNTQNNCDPHSIKTRKVGYRVSIDLHIKFDRNMTFTEVHSRMNAIKKELREQFGRHTFVAITPEPFN